MGCCGSAPIVHCETSERTCIPPSKYHTEYNDEHPYFTKPAPYLSLDDDVAPFLSKSAPSSQTTQAETNGVKTVGQLLNSVMNTGDLNDLTLLIEKKQDDIKNLYGLLVILIQRGHLEAVKVLLSNHVPVNTRLANDGNTAAHLCVVYNQASILEYLINQHANLNLRNRYAHTTLDIAILRKTADLVELLVDNNAYVSHPNLDVTDVKDVSHLTEVG